MIDTEDFIQTMNQENIQPTFKLADVIDLFKNGTAKIMFDGEDVASEKEYSYIASYIPNVGDRVVLAPISNTYIILGKVMYAELIEEEEAVDRYMFDEKQVTIKKGISVDDGATIDKLKVQGHTEIETIKVNSDSEFNSITANKITSKELEVDGSTSINKLKSEEINTKSLNSTNSVISNNIRASSLTADNITSTNNLTVSQSTFNSEAVFRGGINSQQKIYCGGTMQHAGNNLGFFGTYPVRKTIVSTNYNDQNSMNLTFKAVITALKSYGLI